MWNGFSWLQIGDDLIGVRLVTTNLVVVFLSIVMEIELLLLRHKMMEMEMTLKR